MLQYTYDPVYRLTSGIYSGTTTVYTFAYGYDGVGNRTAQTRTLTSTHTISYTYDNANRLTNAGGQAYSWDANGNLLTLCVDDLNGFRIEVRERDSGGASATYTYPMPAGKTWRFHQWIHDNTVYLDNYVERADSVLSTVYLGNYYEQDLAVSNSIRTYYYLGGKRVATGNAAGLYFIHGDQLGSASLVTSITGTVVTQMLFKPFGLVRWWTGTLETDYRFTGQRQESNAGLYDFGGRFYDQQLGRFVSADIIVPNPSNPQGFNRYGYVRNNPLRYTDPTGHIDVGEEADASVIVKELLDDYNIRIIVDWGKNSSGSWDKGLWLLKELKLVQGAAKDLNDKIGSIAKASSGSAITIRRVNRDIKGITNWDGSIELGNLMFTQPFLPDARAKWGVVHEIAHAWDFNSDRMRALLSYLSYGAVTGGISSQLGNSVGTEQGPTAYSKTNLFEDWAESVTSYVYQEYLDYLNNPSADEYNAERAVRPQGDALDNKHKQFVELQVNGLK